MEQFTILPENELYVLRKCILKFKVALIKREESNTYLKGYI